MRGKPMRTVSAVYKGDRVVELLEDVDFPADMAVWVVIPGQDDERTLHNQMQSAAEAVLTRLWDNQEDDVWNEYV
jgi:hypothetical protein